MASDGTSSPVLCINAGREPHRFVIRLRVLQSNISLVNRVNSMELVCYSSYG